MELSTPKKRVFTEEQKIARYEAVKKYRERKIQETGLSWYQLNKASIFRYREKIKNRRETDK